MLKEEESKKMMAEFNQRNKPKYSILDDGDDLGLDGMINEKNIQGDDFDVDLSGIDSPRRMNEYARRNGTSYDNHAKAKEHESKLSLMGAEIKGMAMAAAYHNANKTAEFDTEEDEKIRSEIGNEDGKISLNGRKLVVDSPSETSTDTGYKSEFGFYGGSTDSRE